MTVNYEEMLLRREIIIGCLLPSVLSCCMLFTGFVLS